MLNYTNKLIDDLAKTCLQINMRGVYDTEKITLFLNENITSTLSHFLMHRHEEKRSENQIIRGAK